MAISHKSTDVNSLKQVYLDAENRRRTFVEQIQEPLSPEDSAEAEWLGKLALEALADLYEAGGTTLETEEQTSTSWEKQGDIQAEAIGELAAATPEDPLAVAAAEHFARQADYRHYQAADPSVATDEKVL